ncbi:putative membrane protein [Sinobacterium caligoides]|uniref:Putative membrane protein n=1 Tax=Sinobacterium caligoides TaxID=933926 RepID=A0A3N2D548_9GAMM|nr:TPM domain-containing protein [Sinobacterium caligoides]ROR94935.1 putative membrane protein [Sinobacterium caligoides]
MKQLKNTQAEAVRAAISQVEENTDAELVAVLAHQADSYQFITTLWAALAALMLPSLLWVLGFWLQVSDIFLVQFITMVSLLLLFRWSWLLGHIVPKSVRLQRAASLARCEYLHNNLQHTKGQTGVLIFISKTERYVEIIAGPGIDQYVEQTHWKSIVDTLTESIKDDRTLPGLVTAIESCGELLAQYVPATEAKNELPNHLVVLNKRGKRLFMTGAD